MYIYVIYNDLIFIRAPYLVIIIIVHTRYTWLLCVRDLMRLIICSIIHWTQCTSVVDMGSNGWCGQCTCWQCGGVWWTWGPMDGVVSPHAGSVVVCGGHGVQWMAWLVHMLVVWWCVVDMGQCDGVWWTWGSVVVCGGHGAVWWCVVDMGQCGGHGAVWWCVVGTGQCGGVWWTWGSVVVCGGHGPVWWCVVDMWQCGGMWWVRGSVVVCGGHRECGGVWWTCGSVVVCGGHGAVWWCVVAIGSVVVCAWWTCTWGSVVVCGGHGAVWWGVVDMGSRMLCSQCVLSLDASSLAARGRG